MTSPIARPILRLALAGLAATPLAAQDLPQLTLDPAATTVSGLSSGAFMAVQLHLAFSEGIAGAGVVAGGPFDCAGGRLLDALFTCMRTDPGGPPVDPLVARAQELADEGMIDPLTGLTGDRVYLFSGTQDETVERPSSDSAAAFYLAAGIDEADLLYVTDIPAGHGFLAEGGPVPCGATEPPFITDCGVDQAGDILTWLYGPLAHPVAADRSRLLDFDQAAYLGDPELHEMNPKGFVYVPESCAQGATCRLHIALHGCRQGRAQLDDIYAWTTGYNGWAEANGIVVLYPQAMASALGGNPRGCWDWWGYDSAFYATKRGPQIAAIGRMAAALGVDLNGATPICAAYDSFNAVHLAEGRAETCGGVFLCAVGSGDAIGTVAEAVTLYEGAAGSYATAPCAAE